MSIRIVVTMFAMSCLSLGCGSGSDLPPMAPVEGVVTLDGEPLKLGSVQFYPDQNEGEEGRMAVGAIGKDGTYQMTTLNPGDGVIVGKHRVAIQAFEETKAFDPNHPAPSESKSLIPMRYNDPMYSELAAEVKAGTDNKINFDLKSKK